MMFGIFLKGSTDKQALHLSLMTLILLSTSATYSEVALVLITTLGILGMTLLNSISINIDWIVNPALEYKLIILFRLLAN